MALLDTDKKGLAMLLGVSASTITRMYQNPFRTSSKNLCMIYEHLMEERNKRRQQTA